MTAKPMDPERLAILRARYSEKGWMIQDPNARDFVRDLLAAHDYHAQQAEESRQDAAVAAVRCLEHFDNATSLVIEIARLRARVTVVASDVIAVFKSGDGGDCVIMYRTPRLLVVRCACFRGK